MAPMTRSRADANDCANELMVEYYRQRASAGLIITEGSQPSANGKGYLRTPGIYNQQQIESWKKSNRRRSCKGRPDRYADYALWPNRAPGQQTCRHRNSGAFSHQGKRRNLHRRGYAIVHHSPGTGYGR